jgi:hypothetical protein
MRFTRASSPLFGGGEQSRLGVGTEAEGELSRTNCLVSFGEGFGPCIYVKRKPEGHADWLPLLTGVRGVAVAQSLLGGLQHHRQHEHV